jgi:methylenetetrahydrofolate reductase (NADPH)
MTFASTTPDLGGAKSGGREIANFASNFSIEITPGAAKKCSDFREVIRPGASVYITYIAGSNFDDTVTVAERLRREGLEPVPHFAVRSMHTIEEATRALASLRDRAGVEQILLIAGGVAQPVGELRHTMQLLESGVVDRLGIKRIGVAGHPEGTPDIPSAEVSKALCWKNEFAERSDAKFHIVTQFCFEAAPIIAWDKQIQSAGNRLPIHIGVPGPASIKTLMAYAKACGVGPSARFLMKQARTVSKLLTVSAPDRLIQDLARYRSSDPACGIVKMHMFPLGGFERSARWAYAVSDGLLTIKPTGGFTVRD